MSFRKIASWYTNFARILFAILLAFLFLNGSVLIYEVLAKPIPQPSKPPEAELLPIHWLGSLSQFDFDHFRQVYPDLSDAQIIRLQLENWNLVFLCDENTVWREAPFAGEHVTVDPAGFRWGADQAPWPPPRHAYTVFIFGGSTAFGWSELDQNTIPSRLQERLRARSDTGNVNVYNFAHGAFFSRQERREFERLLGSGFVPDLALFIDGFNDFQNWHGEPMFNVMGGCHDTMREKLSNSLSCRHDEYCWPLQRLQTQLSNQLWQRYNTKYRIERRKAPAYDDVVTNTAIVNRWIENKSAIEVLASEYGVETLFVMQPVSTYAYDLRHHLFVEYSDGFWERQPEGFWGQQPRTHWGYAVWERMAAQDTDRKWTSNFVNLAHLAEGRSAPLYLDRIHYTGPFMTEIALAMAGEIESRGLLGDASAESAFAP